MISMFAAVRLIIMLALIAALCAGGSSAASNHGSVPEARAADRMAHAVHHMAPDAEACDMSIAHCTTAALPCQSALVFERVPCPIRHASARLALADLARADLDTPPPRS